MASYVKRKKNMIFQSGDSLQQVVNVVNEAAIALDDGGRTIRESSIPEVLGGALGAGIGGAGSFAALYGLGTVGLSAAGITSGLATAGSIVGGGMVAGVAAIYRAVDEVEGHPVRSVYSVKDLPDYESYDYRECPYCKAGRKIDALVNSYGYSVI